MRGEEDITPGEFLMRIFIDIALGLSTVAIRDPGGPLFPQNLHQLRPTPDVEGALTLFMRMGRIRCTIGIFGRPESSFGRSHIAQNIIQGAARGHGEARVAGDLERLHVRHDQLRLVVEHFFEVRHKPLCVH